MRGVWTRRSSVAIRPAATIVVARDADRGIEVLMVRRPRAMEFAGGAHVFPGGAVDPRGQ